MAFANRKYQSVSDSGMFSNKAKTHETDILNRMLIELESNERLVRAKAYQLDVVVYKPAGAQSYTIRSPTRVEAEYLGGLRLIHHDIPMVNERDSGGGCCCSIM